MHKHFLPPKLCHKAQCYVSMTPEDKAIRTKMPRVTYVEVMTSLSKAFVLGNSSATRRRTELGS